MWFEDHRGGLLEGTYVRSYGLISAVCDIDENDENRNVGTKKRRTDQYECMAL